MVKWRFGWLHGYRACSTTLLSALIAIGLTLESGATGVSAATKTPPPFQQSWVETFVPTHLWSAAVDPAVDYGQIPQWTFLLVVAPQTTPRLAVWVPWTKNYAFVDAKSVGPSGPPSAAWLAAVSASQQPGASANWQGRVVAGGVPERQAPSSQAAIVQTLPGGTPVQVVGWVVGDEVNYTHWTWAKLADGGYAYADLLQVTPPTSPPAIPPDHPAGQWIDVNLLHQTAVAYQDGTPQHLAIVSTGSPGWETPTGLFHIWSQVADATMDGSTLNHLGLDAWHAARTNYDLTHVLFTQYFDSAGDALHDNYWLPAADFGVPHSHGCVGLQLADAQWFWNWASTGVPVLIHN
jgi:hypothetical protein